MKFIKGIGAFFTIGLSLGGFADYMGSLQLGHRRYTSAIISIIFAILSVWLIYRMLKPKVKSNPSSISECIEIPAPIVTAEPKEYKQKEYVLETPPDKPKVKSNPSSISECIEIPAPIVTAEPKEYKQKEYVLETPPEILHDMKSFYNIKEIPNLLRILDDCWRIVNNSNNIETVFSRLELAKQNAYTLKQLEQCGLYTSKPTSDFYLDRFVGQTDGILKNAIDRSYHAMLSRAYAELKTLNAQERRRMKYFDMLSEHEEFFSPDLEEFIEKLKKQ